MATRPQTNQTDVSELDAFRGDRAQLEAQEVAHNRTTETTASEHDIAHIIRVSFGAEPIPPMGIQEEVIPKVTTEQPAVPVVEASAAPAQVYEKNLTAQAEATAPIDPLADLSIDEKRAGVDQAYAEAGVPEIKLPEAA